MTRLIWPAQVEKAAASQQRVTVAASESIAHREWREMREAEQRRVEELQRQAAAYLASQAARGGADQPAVSKIADLPPDIQRLFWQLGNLHHDQDAPLTARERADVGALQGLIRQAVERGDMAGVIEAAQRASGYLSGVGARLAEVAQRAAEKEAAHQAREARGLAKPIALPMRPVTPEERDQNTRFRVPRERLIEPVDDSGGSGTPLITLDALDFVGSPITAQPGESPWSPIQMTSEMYRFVISAQAAIAETLPKFMDAVWRAPFEFTQIFNDARENEDASSWRNMQDAMRVTLLTYADLTDILLLGEQTLRGYRPTELDVFLTVLLPAYFAGSGSWRNRNRNPLAYLDDFEGDGYIDDVFDWNGNVNFSRGGSSGVPRRIVINPQQTGIIERVRVFMEQRGLNDPNGYIDDPQFIDLIREIQHSEVPPNHIEVTPRSIDEALSAIQARNEGIIASVTRPNPDLHLSQTRSGPDFHGTWVPTGENIGIEIKTPVIYNQTLQQVYSRILADIRAIPLGDEGFIIDLRNLSVQEAGDFTSRLANELPSHAQYIRYMNNPR